MSRRLADGQECSVEIQIPELLVVSRAFLAIPSGIQVPEAAKVSQLIAARTILTARRPRLVDRQFLPVVGGRPRCFLVLYKEHAVSQPRRQLVQEVHGGNQSPSRMGVTDVEAEVRDGDLSLLKGAARMLMRR